MAIEHAGAKNGGGDSVRHSQFWPLTAASTNRNLAIRSRDSQNRAALAANRIVILCLASCGLPFTSSRRLLRGDANPLAQRGFAAFLPRYETRCSVRSAANPR